MSIARRPFRRRFLLPVGLLWLVWLATNALLAVFAGRPEALGGAGAYRPALTFWTLLRFGLLLTGTLFVYPAMFFLGASQRERIVGSVVVPLTYMVWSIFQATAFFPMGQAIYYGFNSMTFGSLFLQVGLMGLAEMGCRAWYRLRRREPIRVVSWAAVAAVIVGAAAIYATLIWEGGVHWFYLYNEGYKLLFQ